MASNPLDSARTFKFSTIESASSEQHISAALLAPLEQSLLWSRILSIIGLLFTGVALLIMGGLAVYWMQDSIEGGLLLLLVTVPLLLLVYGIPSWRLFCFGSEVAALTRAPTARQFEVVLEAKRKFWRYVGGVALVLTTLVSIAIGLTFMRTVINLIAR